jgi:hypothetical protein
MKMGVMKAYRVKNTHLFSPQLSRFHSNLVYLAGLGGTVVVVVVFIYTDPSQSDMQYTTTIYLSVYI